MSDNVCKFKLKNKIKKELFHRVIFGHQTTKCTGNKTKLEKSNTFNLKDKRDFVLNIIINKTSVMPVKPCIRPKQHKYAQDLPLKR